MEQYAEQSSPPLRPSRELNYIPDASSSEATEDAATGTSSDVPTEP